MVVEILLDRLTDPQQLAWARYLEGDCEILAKIVRARNGWPFVSIPTAYRKGIQIPLYRYPNGDLWKAKQQAILEAFELAVPPEIFYPPKDEATEAD